MKELDPGTFIESTKDFKTRLIHLILALRDANNEEDNEKWKLELDQVVMNILVCPRGNEDQVPFSAYFYKLAQKGKR